MDIYSGQGSIRIANELFSVTASISVDAANGSWEGAFNYPPRFFASKGDVAFLQITVGSKRISGPVRITWLHTSPPGAGFVEFVGTKPARIEEVKT